MERKINRVMLRFDKFLHATERAYLIRIGCLEHWIPKKLCRNFITNNKLGGNVSIPTFLYEKITGVEAEDIPIGDADFIIEKHVPEKIDATKTEPDADLIR